MLDFMCCRISIVLIWNKLPVDDNYNRALEKEIKVVFAPISMTT